MLVQYLDRKSGQTRAIPVRYVEEGDCWPGSNDRTVDCCLISISLRQRAWWQDQNGALVCLRLRGRDMPARVEIFIDDETVADALLVAVQGDRATQHFLDIHLDEIGHPLRSDALRAAVIRAAMRFYPVM